MDSKGVGGGGGGGGGEVEIRLVHGLQRSATVGGCPHRDARTWEQLAAEWNGQRERWDGLGREERREF